MFYRQGKKIRKTLGEGQPRPPPPLVRPRVNRPLNDFLLFEIAKYPVFKTPGTYQGVKVLWCQDVTIS